MRTENAIDLFGSHWETELVPPDDAADQLDITNYRVVVVQKLGSGRRRPLVASEVALRTPRYSCMVFATREAAEAYINEVLADGETDP